MNPDSWDGLCNKCTTVTCCKNFLTPLITKKELNIIGKKSGFSDFAIPTTIKNIEGFTVKTKPSTRECIFLTSDQKCSIHKYRPFDCRIFPFDIFKINNQYTWVLYTCNPELDWKWSEDILQSFEDELFTDDICNTLDAFSDLERLEEADQMYPHQVLRKVNLKSRKIKSDGIAN